MTTPKDEESIPVVFDEPSHPAAGGRTDLASELDLSELEDEDEAPVTESPARAPTLPPPVPPPVRRAPASELDVEVVFEADPSRPRLGHEAPSLPPSPQRSQLAARLGADEPPESEPPEPTLQLPPGWARGTTRTTQPMFAASSAHSDEPPRTEPPPSATPSWSVSAPARHEHPGTHRGRHLIVVGGGRGGVGKSAVAEGLAVYFAQLGKEVVLVDADPNGSNLHARLGTEALARDPFSDDEVELKDVLVETEVPGLRLLPYPHEALRPPTTLRGARRTRWLSRLRRLEVDYVVVDAGPGASPFTVELMLQADVPVMVTTPEPPAVEATYRFLRQAFLAKLRRHVHHDRLRSGILERALSAYGHLPPPLPFVRTLATHDPGLAEMAWLTCQSLQFQLVVNQTRLRADVELGSFMSELVWRRYGIALQELGHIEYDDSVHFAVRRRRSLLVDNPAAKAARNMERLARRVLGRLLTADVVSAPASPLPPLVPHYYGALGLSRGASDEELRRNFRRRREMVHEDSIATFSLFSRQELRLEQARLEEAYDTLMDPMRRRAYDLSLFPETEVSMRPIAVPSVRDRVAVENELARELGPDTEFSGAMLRRVREAYGASLEEIAQQSKITRTHLMAIEEERWSDLPATVYVRGYVTEYAKFFGLDPAHVQRTFMRRLQAARSA